MIDFEFSNFKVKKLQMLWLDI